MITHHPHEEMIVEYANGSLPAAEALLVASHASMCAECRARIAEFEAVGAALLDGGEEAFLDADSLSAVLDRIDDLADDADEAGPEASVELDEETRRLVPPPLRSLLSASLSSLEWRRIGRGLRRAALGEYGTGRVSLIEINPGRSVPTHTHSGEEYTLVLKGAFVDGDTEYAAGDVAFADPDVNHRPEAAPEGPCLCLTIESGPVRLTGPIGRLFNPVIKG